MSAKPSSAKAGIVAIKISSGVLIALGTLVIFAWHAPLTAKSLYLPLIMMAYNTAISFVIGGLVLLLFVLQRCRLMVPLCLLLYGLSLLALVETLAHVDLHGGDWFYFMLTQLPPKPVLMAPTTATCFILESTALLLISLAECRTLKNIYLPVILCTGIAFAMALIALLGHGIGLFPITIWQGVVMAPQTSIGHCILSLTLFLYAYPSAHYEFDRLSVFNRMIIAFCTMVTLFVGVGSIAVVQIASVSYAVESAYSRESHGSTAIYAIRLEVNDVERSLNAFALGARPADQVNFYNALASIDLKIVEVLGNPMDSTTGRPEHRPILASYNRWKQAATTTYLQLMAPLKAQNIAASLALTEQCARDFEQQIDKVILQGAGRAGDFKAQLAKADLGARLFVSVTVLCLLFVGFLLIYAVTRSISRQLLQIRLAMRAIADGDNQIIIPCLDNPREIGDMARTLVYFASQIQLRHQTEARMRKIIEIAPNGFIIVDQRGVIEIVNNEAERIFGYTREELIGNIIEILVPKQERDHHPGYRADFFAHPSHRIMGTGREMRGLHKNGSEVPVEIVLTPIDTAAGPKVLASIVDITERLKTANMINEHQAELQKINQQLTATNKELATFTYVASHDLKSPLRGIEQISNWIEEDIEAQEYDNLGSHTRMLRKRINRMEKLLDDLLNYYRAGHDKGELSVIDVRHLAMEIFEIHNTNPDMQLECAETLPVFTTVSAAFEQVLRNLISNAIKHHDLPSGFIILTHREINAQFYEFCVCDDGPGVPEAFHQRIFGMFQTLRPRDEVEGSGIGLSLIKKIVGNFGGSVWIESNGRGSCFFFTWPQTITRLPQDVR